MPLPVATPPRVPVLWPPLLPSRAKAGDFADEAPIISVLCCLVRCCPDVGDCALDAVFESGQVINYVGQVQAGMTWHGELEVKTAGENAMQFKPVGTRGTMHRPFKWMHCIEL